ncbi:hypothetical protein PG985_015035 [Apiospora marii]|uniref:C2H2-type domain-containing protein n=1 Tax=Apiospora marii TaxID=335849 RepID=A0ABR1RJB8_9PEZI
MGIKNKRTTTKTRRHLRDLDQIKADLLSPRHLELYKETKATDDLPDLGKWYCVECAKWFESERNMIFHQKGKPHKRRVKQMKEEPYTQREAEAAVGLGVDNEGPSKVVAKGEDEAMMT